MSGNNEVDQCPFCNAAWGECLHVQLLMELDGEAIAKSTPEGLGSTSASNTNAPAKKQDPVASAAAQTASYKTVRGSR